MNIGKDSYILMSQGKGYMVSKEDGEWVATSIESMNKMMDMSGMRDLMARMGKHSPRDDRPPRFEKTGRVETVAGIRGEVYTLAIDNAVGQPETTEIVFGDDPRLVRLHQAQAKWTEQFGMMGNRGDSSYSDLIKKYAKNGPGGAILRYADVMKLESLQEAKLAESHFKVPRVKEIDLGSTREKRGHNPNRPVQSQPFDSTDLEREIKNARMRQKAETRDLGEKATEKEKDEVMEGVNSLLKGLFGN